MALLTAPRIGHPRGSLHSLASRLGSRLAGTTHTEHLQRHFNSWRGAHGPSLIGDIAHVCAEFMHLQVSGRERAENQKNPTQLRHSSAKKKERLRAHGGPDTYKNKVFLKIQHKKQVKNANNHSAPTGISLVGWPGFKSPSQVGFRLPKSGPFGRGIKQSK